PPAGLALRLRAATRASHDRVDGAFPRGLEHLEDYVRYLRALWPLARWLDESWQPAWAGHARWHQPARLRQLRADLALLGAAPPDPVEPAAPAAGAAEWLGGCYVLEGSAVGARLLARDLDRLLPRHPRLAGARGFINAHLAEPGRWACFRNLLDSLPGDA